LDLKRANVNPTVNHSVKTGATLIEKRRRLKVRIASIDGSTARQQRVRQGMPAVILQRPKHRIGPDLVAGASQNPESIIATKVVAK
jgi:hypothetical protein